MSEHELKEALQKSSRKPRASEQAAPTTAEGSSSELVRLQRLVGNHAVQRMLAGDQKRTGMIIQTKMTVGAADDPYEREADAVASQVMAKRDIVQRAGEEDELQMKRVDTVQREGEEDELQMKRMDIVQREGEEDELQMKRVDIVQRAEEEDELQMKRMDVVQREGEEDELQMKRVDIVQRAEEEDELQMKRTQRKDDEQVDMSGSFDVNNDVESRISSASGSGQTIPDVNREMFESSMGHDFSGVNIHADSESDSLNKEIGARAFTTGSDIFFRQGEYNPASSGGQELLAHELTHVVQQGGASAVQKKKDEE